MNYLDQVPPMFVCVLWGKNLVHFVQLGERPRAATRILVWSLRTRSASRECPLLTSHEVPAGYC
jgi:hypothetical protein